MRELLQQALDCFETLQKIPVHLSGAGVEQFKMIQGVTSKLKAELAKPGPEPDAWLYPEGLAALRANKCWTVYPLQHDECNIALYLAPPSESDAVALLREMQKDSGLVHWMWLAKIDAILKGAP